MKLHFLATDSPIKIIVISDVSLNLLLYRIRMDCNTFLVYSRLANNAVLCAHALLSPSISHFHLFRIFPHLPVKFAIRTAYCTVHS